MQASVIIPLYKDLKGLELILLALNRQTAAGSFEVIVAEDDNAPETIAFLQSLMPTLRYPVIHISHQDRGFRKCEALNNAVKKTTADYLIFIDGDCIPHKNFVEQYLKEREDNKILYGRRVNLGEKITAKLISSKDLGLLSFIRLLFTDSTRVKEALYIPFMPAVFKSKRQFWGCNWGILKKHFEAINGYDEDYTEYGFEDLDIYSRMNMAGFVLKSVKFQCIVYHLYHKTRAFDELMNRGKMMYEEKMKAGRSECVNGLKKINLT